MISGLFHGGITVDDMERSLRFYRDGLGLEVASDRIANESYLYRVLEVATRSSVRIVYLRMRQTSAFIELLEFLGEDSSPKRSEPTDPGAGHLSLYVDGLEDLHRRLSDQGYRYRGSGPVLITAGPNRGAKAVYFHDPDGYLIELFEAAKAEALG